MHRSAAVVVLSVGLVACSPGRPEPLVLFEQDSTTLVVITRCDDEDDRVRFSADESDDTVRVRFAGGSASYGDDCEGSGSVSLDGPLADRAVVVDGDEWIPASTDCGLRAFVPLDESIEDMEPFGCSSYGLVPSEG